jgi:hypothetical protein
VWFTSGGPLQNTDASTQTANDAQKWDATRNGPPRGEAGCESRCTTEDKLVVDSYCFVSP